MRISFDLDDTLVANGAFPTESQSFFHRILNVEPIRAGTIELFKELRHRGHEIYVYTTSYRKARHIKLMFRSYGIPVDYVINQQLHIKRIVNTGMHVSKFPPAFGIDIHVDDSRGVGMEGEKHNFKTIIVAFDDNAWVDYILSQI